MTDTLKQRPGDQPLPQRNTNPVIQDLVAADIEARRQIGIQRYGTALQPHNGRDAYEEALDLTMYLRQALYERDNPAERRHRPLSDEPCGVIPTEAGLDYLALRRQQHPKAADR